MDAMKQDVEELEKLLELATRQRSKDALTHAKIEAEREMMNLEMRTLAATKRKSEGKDKRYFVELTEYAWDQSDKFVKLFVTLTDVQSCEESAVNVTFSGNSMQLNVSNLKNKDFGLTVKNLLGEIDPERSYRKIKNGMISIYMKKVNEREHWDVLTTIQKRIKQNKDSEMTKNSDNPESALVNIMKKMYNEGDSKTKQMIAKAWTESQEKARNGADEL